MDKQIEKAAFAAIPFKGLVGRKIVTVRYCTTDELNNWGWSSNPLILELDDGTVLIPQSDPEGNDGGALAILKNGKETIA